MWENGCGQGVGSTQDLLDNLLPFWIDNYFSHPSYLRVEGKPLLYIWVPRNVTRHLASSPEVRAAFDAMRARCREKGLGGLYIVGCVGAADDRDPPGHGPGRLGRQFRLRLRLAAARRSRRWAISFALRMKGSSSNRSRSGKRQARLRPAARHHRRHDGLGLAPLERDALLLVGQHPRKFRDFCRRAKAVMDAGGGTGPATNTLIFCCWNELARAIISSRRAATASITWTSSARCSPTHQGPCRPRAGRCRARLRFLVSRRPEGGKIRRRPRPPGRGWPFPPGIP